MMLPIGRLPHAWRHPAASSAAAVLLVLLLVLPFVPLGAMPVRMTAHIVSMNVLAPVLALVFLQGRSPSGPASLWLAALAQSAALWLAHAPVVHDTAMIVSQMALFALAVWFWGCVVAQRWHAIGALLVTGKLACLLGVLLVFAPRAIHGDGALADQQLAGLLMIAACPLAYVLPAILIAASILADLSRQPVAVAAAEVR